jgi:hypothetical protein
MGNESSSGNPQKSVETFLAEEFSRCGGRPRWEHTPYFEEICDGHAAEGFGAFDLDRYGDLTAPTIEEVEALQRQREDEVRTEAALRASVKFLRAHEAVVRVRLGALGSSARVQWALPSVSRARKRSPGDWVFWHSRV